MNPKQIVGIVAAAAAVVALLMYVEAGPFNAGDPIHGTDEVYTCPMHPSVQSDRPGACPVCGMALVKRSTSLVPDIVPEDLRLVSLSPTQRLVANVGTVPVKRGTISKEIRLAGTVNYAEPLQATVAARFSGRIETLHADFTGKRVERNDPLFELYSPDLVSAQREFLLALGNVDIDTGGGTGFLRIAGMNHQLLEASREKLRVHFGLTDGQMERLQETRDLQSTVTFHSPISGTVVRKSVVQGQYVDEGMTLYELADLSMVWIYFDVYESDLRFITKGRNLTIFNEAYPDESFSGKVIFIDPVLNPETRTVRIRTEAANRDGKLKPNMYATALLREGTPNALIVPAGAVLSTGKRTVVWVEVGENSFEPRDVVLGVINESSAEVLGGLEEGEMVVATGGYLLDSESSLQMPSGEDSHPGQHSGADSRTDPIQQEITIRVAGGYFPNVVHLRKGSAAKLHFFRDEASKCTEEVVLRDFGIRARLPQGEMTTLEVTPEETGEFVFSCGMNMIHGKIVVHE